MIRIGSTVSTQCKLNGFRVISLKFGGKSKIWTSRTSVFRMYEGGGLITQVVWWVNDPPNGGFAANIRPLCLSARLLALQWLQYKLKDYVGKDLPSKC